MYYPRYMQRGGCATCGIENNNFSSTFSSNFYNNINRNNNDYNNYSHSNSDLAPNSFTLYNSRQRIMTPPRNNSNYNLDNDINNDINQYNTNKNNYNNYHNYYSPARNSGCRSCSMSPSKTFNHNDYIRPSTGNPLKINNNNMPNYNNLNYRNNDDYKFRQNYYNNNNNNIRIHQNNNDYNFRKKYEISKNDDVSENSFNQNRYFSPARSFQRNLSNTISRANINNYNNNYNNNYYNNFNHNDDKYNNSDNSIKTMFNNQDRNYLNDNINKYNLNNNSKNNYYKPKNRIYYSPSIKNKRNNNNDNNYSRYNYLLPKEQNYTDNNRFMTLNIFNYRNHVREKLRERKTLFVVIYGTHDYTGKSWCSDCNIAMPNIEEAKNIIKNRTYDKEVYFIDIPIDKINMKDLNEDPIIQLERVPTLIFFENGIERNRLIENELFSSQNVHNFILQAYNQYSPSRNDCLYHPRNYY